MKKDEGVEEGRGDSKPIKVGDKETKRKKEKIVFRTGDRKSKIKGDGETRRKKTIKDYLQKRR